MRGGRDKGERVNNIQERILLNYENNYQHHFAVLLASHLSSKFKSARFCDVKIIKLGSKTNYQSKMLIHLILSIGYLRVLISILKEVIIPRYRERSLVLGKPLHRTKARVPSIGNRQLSRWGHLTTTARIQFVFLFFFKFCIPNGVKITITPTSMRQGKPE